MQEPHHFNLLSRVNGFGFPFVGAPLDLTRQRESQNHQIVMTGKKIKSKLEMRKKIVITSRIPNSSLPTNSNEEKKTK